MESLACHLMIKVHLHAVCCYLKNNAWDNSTHAVHHRDCVAWYEKVLANLTIYFESSFWKVDDSIWISLTICINR